MLFFFQWVVCFLSYQLFFPISCFQLFLSADSFLFNLSRVAHPSLLVHPSFLTRFYVRFSSWRPSIITQILSCWLTTISRFQYTGIFNNLIIVSKYIFGVRWCFGAIAYQVIILSSPVDRCFRDLIYSNVILMPF